MIADDVNTAVDEPTDWVNSIMCNVKETPEGKKKIRLCLDPKDLNKNLRREHYYTRTIDELLPQLHGKKFFSVVDTKKGYWHVALDHESSLLCTFNLDDTVLNGYPSGSSSPKKFSNTNLTRYTKASPM